MTDIRLRGRLPKGDANGIAASADDFLKEPGELRLVLGLLDVAQIVDDLEDGDKVVVLKFRKLEAIVGDDLETLKRIMMRANEERTGQTMIPFETEEEINTVFARWAGLDPDNPDDPDDPGSVGDEGGGEQ